MKQTRERIKSAFLEYLRVKPYDKIKVSDIIKTAEVNRSTFYRNYSDVISLYTDICEELVDGYISEMPEVKNEYDMIEAVSSLYNKAILPENLEYINLVSGANGNGEAPLVLRRRFVDKIELDMREENMWTDRMRYLSTFGADFLMISAFYLLHSNGFEETDYYDSEYSFDYSADPVDIFADIAKKAYGGSNDVHISLFLSTIRMFSLGDARVKPVTELLSHSGFSRTVFYRIYNDKSDYFSKLEKALNFLAVNAILPIMIKNDVSAYEVLLEQWDRYYMAVERKALFIAFRDGYAFRLGANVVTQLHRAYLNYIMRETGRTPDWEEEKRISFFVSSIVCSLTYYYVTLDKTAFYERMQLLYELKDKEKAPD